MLEFKRPYKNDLTMVGYWELTFVDDPCDDVSHWIGLI